MRTADPGAIRMTPQRAHTLVTHAMTTAKGVATAPVEAASVAYAAGAAGIAWVVGAGNMPLLWVVGLAMLMDLIVGAMRAVTDPLQEFTVERMYGGFLGKIFRLLLIPTASLVDWLYIVSPLPLPDGYEAAFPVTSMVMLGLAAAEITSSLNKFRDGGVAPSLIAAVVRHLDRVRTGTEPPLRRHYDTPALVEEAEMDQSPVRRRRGKMNSEDPQAPKHEGK